MEKKLQKYEYMPLDGPNDIRLLELMPDAYDSETMIFDCNLRTIDLKDANHPCYYTLSYTWKLPDIEEEEAPLRPSPVHIRCDGRIIEIGENLFDCLYQLHHLPEDDDGDVALVWIDAICTNQADLEERSSQVAMMQEIYAKAVGTLIWLGRQDMISLQAVPLIKQLSEIAATYLPKDKEASCRTTLVAGNIFDEDLFLEAGITPLTLSDWHSIKSFFSRSWFHRIWTVQELVTGEYDSKIMLCGDTVLSLEDIGGFIQLSMVKGWINTLGTLDFTRSRNGSARTCLGIEVSLSMGAISKAPRDSSISRMLQHLFNYQSEESLLGAKFAWMLTVCRQKQTTDERDRIFASSGMISQYGKSSWWHLLKPDYSKSTEEVFINASKLIIQSLGNLSWLSFVQDNSLRVQEHLPSWVPDLAAVARPLWLAYVGNYNVFRNCEGTYSLLMDDVNYSHYTNCNTISLVSWQQHLEPNILAQNALLYVKAFKLEKLAYATHDLNKTFFDHKITDILIAAAKFAIYAPGETWLDALMKTLAVGTSFDLDFNIGAPLSSSSSKDFDELRSSFSYFLKLEIAQEMWSWSYFGAKTTSNWWEAHADFAHLCDSGNLLPPREELEEFFSNFSALYPSNQNTKTNPTIEDKDYLETLYNPTTPYARRVTLNFSFRAFVQTQQAHMGLAPLSAKPEDEIWIIKGAKVPFILRRRSDDSYEVIGEAYIHGIMHGELFEDGNHFDFHNIALK